MALQKGDLKKWAQACEAFEKQNYGEAISLFQSASENSKICFNLGMCYFAQNKTSDAGYYFSRSVEYDTFLAIGYFMRGVCCLLTKDADAAYWDFNSALEKLRDNDFIDYTQMKLKYKIYRSQILFNMAASLVEGGRDASELIAEAQRCPDVHEDQKATFQSGLAGLMKGQKCKPLTVDNKLFNPPLSQQPGARGGRGTERAESKPPAPTNSLPATPSRSAPEPAPSPVRATPATPARSFEPQPTNVNRAAVAPAPVPARQQVKPATPKATLPATPKASLPATPKAKPVELMKLTVFYKDKRFVEVPKDNPSYPDLVSRIEQKFGTPNLLVKYQNPSTQYIEAITSQQDLDEALARGFAELYVNRKGETNIFEPEPPSEAPEPEPEPAPENGEEEWLEAYTPDGEVYYYSTITGETAWEKPEPKPKVVAKPTPVKTQVQSNSSFRNNASSAVAPKTTSYTAPQTQTKSTASSTATKQQSGYFSRQRTESFVEPPQGVVKKAVQKESEWQEAWTDDGQKYYYNIYTYETAWDPPS
mmetsp:Transcript_25405/g.35623  ORF Transcript_25405/g.35623 Transcript_25405/m.35623 type:complete len:534 (-) Transcript_25405:49-1650(-)